MRQLEGHAVCMDSRAALTEKHRPLPSALWAYLVAGRGAPTLVLRQRQPGVTLRAFGQLGLCRGRSQARLVTLAAEPVQHESTLWLQMLDALTVQAGQSGAHALLAEVSDTAPSFEALRRAEFVVYTRQEIWVLTGEPSQQFGGALRPEQPDDRWYIQQLVSNTVPRLIQQIDPVDQTSSGLVWMEDGDPLAYASIHRGSRGLWLQLYLHPQAEETAHSIIQQTTAHYRPAPGIPLYCCVRRYQEWLNRPLAESGFETLGHQAVMVRHTAVRAARPQRLFLPAREKGFEVTSPMVQARERRT